MFEQDYAREVDLSPAPSPEPWRAKLLLAADLIDRGGLAKERVMQGTARCVHGAINQVFYGHPVDWRMGGDPEYAVATTAIAKVVGFKNCDDNGPHGYAIARWNNAPERTKDEVVSALRRAAKERV